MAKAKSVTLSTKKKTVTLTKDTAKKIEDMAATVFPAEPEFRADRTMHVQFCRPGFPTKGMTLGVSTTELEAQEAHDVLIGQRHECRLTADKTAKHPESAQGRLADWSNIQLVISADVMAYTDHGAYKTFTLKLPNNACTANELVAFRDCEGSLEMRHLGAAVAEKDEVQMNFNEEDDPDHATLPFDKAVAEG